LSYNPVIFFGIYESDPISPPEGEAMQGERPFDPLFLVEFFLTFYGLILYVGDARAAGAKASDAAVL
jgi:hypothetical protein